MSPTGDLIVTFIFAGEVLLELAQEPSCVAPELHISGCSPPFRVTYCNGLEEEEEGVCARYFPSR